MKSKTGKKYIDDYKKPGLDCVTSMQIFHARHDVLANALIEAGVIPDGDDEGNIMYREAVEDYEKNYEKTHRRR